ncbi:MAG: hypothetical protein MPJ82_04495, partial [Alphaproteobacteria bacterium]|nr:hypothetical protein [Alphaproteobacteria bacterium]MDA8010562.1 hypothetical protein [Alphaproteobacteria bacterium]
MTLRALTILALLSFFVALLLWGATWPWRLSVELSSTAGADGFRVEAGVFLLGVLVLMVSWVLLILLRWVLLLCLSPVWLRGWFRRLRERRRRAARTRAMSEAVDALLAGDDEGARRAASRARV